MEYRGGNNKGVRRDDGVKRAYAEVKLKGALEYRTNKETNASRVS